MKLDYSKAETTMKATPNWRTFQKLKEKVIRKQNKPFQNLTKEFSLKTKPAWKTIPERLEGVEEPYAGGVHQTELNMLKERAEGDLGKKDGFISATRPKLWETTIQASKSLRTQVVDGLMGVDPVYNHFSRNGYLGFYKEGLVKTGNVDRIIPFKHSNK